VDDRLAERTKKSWSQSEKRRVIYRTSDLRLTLGATLRLGSPQYYNNLCASVKESQSPRQHKLEVMKLEIILV